MEAKYVILSKKNSLRDYFICRSKAIRIMLHLNYKNSNLKSMHEKGLALVE
jgi:hypothetical protein